MKYRCIELDKRLIFQIGLGDMRDEDIDYFLTDSSFLKDLSVFLYKETQKKEVQYCSDTLLVFLFNLAFNLPFFEDLVMFEKVRTIMHFNKINDVIVELWFVLGDFNVNDVSKKYLINNSSFLQTYQDDNSTESAILNMDPIFSDPENSVSLEKDGNVIKYCDRTVLITKEALEKLLDYKKEKNKEEYLLLKIMKESIK